MLKQPVAAPEPPKIIHALAFETLILGFLLIAGGLWLRALGNSMSIFFVCVASAFILLKLRSLTTRVTEAGVSQWTLRGRVDLPWNQITQVTRAPLSFTLASAKMRVVVCVEEFADSAAVVSYIQSHIPSNLRSD